MRKKGGMEERGQLEAGILVLLTSFKSASGGD